MQLVEYQKTDLKNDQDAVLNLNLDFLIDEFNRWIVEYITQQSTLIIKN